METVWNNPLCVVCRRTVFANQYWCAPLEAEGDKRHQACPEEIYYVVREVRTQLRGKRLTPKVARLLMRRIAEAIKEVTR